MAKLLSSPPKNYIVLLTLKSELWQSLLYEEMNFLEVLLTLKSELWQSFKDGKLIVFESC